MHNLDLVALTAIPHFHPCAGRRDSYCGILSAMGFDIITPWGRAYAAGNYHNQ